MRAVALRYSGLGVLLLGFTAALLVAWRLSHPIIGIAAAVMAVFLLIPDRMPAANVLVTVAAYSILAAQLIFVVNLLVSAFIGQRT